MPNLDSAIAIEQGAIAFYAPLKSPLHDTPSGDRKIARLFMAALTQAGFDAQLASQFRSFDKKGDKGRQLRMIALAKKEAARIMRRWRKQQFHPQAWFTYHLYYKAPDLIGPIICKALKIPYILAEASWSEKRANGPWSCYHQQVDSALKAAMSVICINPVDKIALTEYFKYRTHSPLVSLNAFIDDLPDSRQQQQLLQQRKQDLCQEKPILTRQDIADKYQLDAKQPWLITIAMMRSGDKFLSYQLLSEVLGKVDHICQLLIIGDGAMRAEVESLFSSQQPSSSSDLSVAQQRVKFAGVLDNVEIRQLLPHFELLVWPAINEALGMIFLEAQQAGVAIVAGDQGGVSSIVNSPTTGLLVEAKDTQAMSAAIDELLGNPVQLTAMKQAAQHYIAKHHSLAATAVQLKTQLNQSMTNNIFSDQ